MFGKLSTIDRVRGVGSGRVRARGGDRLAPERGTVAALLEQLEPRQMLAFDPTPQEQYILELTNRFRADPQGELARWVNNYGTPARSPYANIDRALRFFNVNGSLLFQQFQALSPVAPLAWNQQLYNAAEFHSQQQINADQQSHQLPGEPGLGQRATNFGYANWTNLAENVYAFAEDANYGQAGFVIDWGDDQSASGGEAAIGGIQSPPGHRNNLLNPTYREVGIRSLYSAPSNTRQTGPWVITQDFGRRSTQTNSFLLGVVYRDNDRDNAYSEGEGLGNVSVSIVGTLGTTGSFSTTTLTAGGYQLAVPRGTYNVTFSGGQYGNGVTYANVVVGSQNVKLDARRGVIPPTPGIAVSGNGIAIVAGDTTPVTTDLTFFGNANTLGQSISRTFTVSNRGTATLSLQSLTSRVRITGANASDFILVQDSAASIAPGASATFSIVFDPTAVGLRNATVSLASNDPSTPTFSFDIQGRGSERGVARITGRGNVIPVGQSQFNTANATFFGSANAPEGLSTRIYTITNVGAGILSLIGADSITFTGAGASNFRVVSQPDRASLAPNESTTVLVQFRPLIAGVINATVNVATSDRLNPNYTYAVQGVGIPVPRAQIESLSGVGVGANAWTPSTLNGTDLGTTNVNVRRVAWFAVRNTGLTNLVLPDLTATPAVTLSGPNPDQFVIGAQPSAQVLRPGEVAYFSVRFRPRTAGQFYATVTLASSDPRYPAYSFAVGGVGV